MMSIVLRSADFIGFLGRAGVLAVFAFLVLVQPSITLATPIGFNYIPNEDSISTTDAQIGEAQLFVDISGGTGTVTFTFGNEGPDEAVISSVYFDDDALLWNPTILDNPPAVDFKVGGSPEMLPGWDVLNPDFMTDFGFGVADGVSGSAKGVGAGESVGFVFDLLGGATLADVIDDINDGTLRIGLHITGFADEGSESFVNVPEPATLILLGLGSLALIGRRRRRS